MKYEITQYSICVPLSEYHWNKLSARENKNGVEIIKRLESVGAYRIDWCGHFGRNIYFSVDKLDDVACVTDEFLSIIRTPLKYWPR